MQQHITTCYTTMLRFKLEEIIACSTAPLRGGGGKFFKLALVNAPVNVKPQSRGAGHTPGDLTFCLRVLTNSLPAGQHVLSNLSYIYC